MKVPRCIPDKGEIVYLYYVKLMMLAFGWLYIYNDSVSL